MLKFKKKIVLSLMVSACMVFAGTLSYAGGVRCEVKVDLVGTTTTTAPASGHVFTAHKVGGTCTGWGSRTQNNFLVPTANGDGMLAVLLTAVSLDKSVFIHSPNDQFPNWGPVQQLYIAP